MAYRKIEPKLWDDEKIAHVSATTKLVWIYLLTGPHTTALPGLWHVGLAQIAEGLRLTFQEVEPALCELERLGRIVRHKACRMIRVPNAPKHNPAENGNAMKTWFRVWKDLPECAMKYEHLDSLMLGVRTPKVRENWNETFATIDPAARAIACAFGSKPDASPSQIPLYSADSSPPPPQQNFADGFPSAEEKQTKVFWKFPPASASDLSDPDLTRTRENAPPSIPPLTVPPESRTVAALGSDPVTHDGVLAELQRHESLSSIANADWSGEIELTASERKRTLSETVRCIAEAAVKERRRFKADPTHRPPNELVNWVCGFLARGSPNPARVSPAPRGSHFGFSDRAQPVREPSPVFRAPEAPQSLSPEETARRAAEARQRLKQGAA